jgi:large subunit ribosomal protein L32
MAHPKRKISKTRRDKRRTHYKATPAAVAKCPTTGVTHLPHRAYVVDGNTYLNGKLIIEQAEEN